MRSLPVGAVLWRGPSLLDGKPVAAVATGLVRPSSNRSTGPAVQVWFIRSHLHPVRARRTGGDSSVCGDCLHRSAGTCYVQVWREVAQVYRSMRRRLYPDLTPDLLTLLRGRTIRYGAYGDPACVPAEVAAMLHAVAGTWLSYTHQWADPRFQELKAYCMASVDSPEQREAALSLGWKTFRVRTHDEPLLPGEFVCPKSEEAGHRLFCLQCGACSGGVWRGEATPACGLHSGLPHQRRHFAEDPRRFLTPLPLV